MPTPIRNVFAAAGLHPEGVVRWGEAPTLGLPGVYVVALTDSIDRCADVIAKADVSVAQTRLLLERRPELTVDDVRPFPRELAARIAAFWLPDETVLYIGTTKRPVAKRVREYYGTPLGARSPHRGGWFIQTLANRNDLFVHFARAHDPEKAETTMLCRFASGVSGTSRSGLHDRERVMPFANLAHPKGTNKRHEIRGAAGARDWVT